MACILVAEDDPVQAELRRCVLEQAGHEVRVAADRDAALGYLPAADVVLMDLRFPAVTDGLALIREIRGTPILVLSGWPEDLYGTPEEALVAEILVKPVPTGELLRAIASAQNRS